MKFDGAYPIAQVHQGYVYLRAFVISLGGLFFGFNNGCFNPTQEHISNMNGWLSSGDLALYTGLITSFLPLGCMIGSLLANPLLKITQSNLRVILIIADILGLIGTTIQILDYNLGNFILGRFLSGVAGGINTSIIPIYLSNFTPVIMRGKTGTFLQTFASLGIFIALSLGAIQPQYATAPKTADKATFIAEQLSLMEPFKRNFAWRILIGLPLIFCIIRLTFLLFVFKEETPIQMVQHHHLRTLKNYLYKAYDKTRADLRFKEVIDYAKTQNEEVDVGSEEDLDRVGNHNYEFSHHTDQLAAPSAAAAAAATAAKNTALNKLPIQTTEHQPHFDSHHNIHSSHDIHQHESSTHQAVELMKSEQQNQHDHHELKVSVHQTTEGAEDHKFNRAAVAEQKTNGGSHKPVFKSQHRRKMLGIVAQCSAQLSGLNALMFFSSSIYKANSDSQDTVQMYLYIQGAAMFFFTFISILFIERYGRRALIMTSTVLTLVGLLGIAIFAFLDIFILSFVMIIFFLFGQCLGLGAVVWPYCAEVVNKSDLSKCTAIRWSCTLCIGATFRFVVLGIGIASSFLIFFVFTLLALLYFIKEMKETKGLSAEQIDELFA